MALEGLLERINPSKYIYELTKREDLTWNIIQKYSSLPWPEWCLSKYAPLDYIIDHPAMLWDYIEVSKRTDLTIDFIKTYQDKLYWWFISRNINFQDVLDNIDLPWDYKSLSSNKKITVDDLIENPELPWQYSNLSQYINLDFVYANPQCKWDYSLLSDRLDLWFIRKNIKKIWNYLILSNNPNLTIDFILEHLDKNWEWEDLYFNPNITLEDLITNNLHHYDFEAFQKKYPDYCVENLQGLNWEIISQYASLDYIRKYPTLPWNYNYISMNTNLTIDFILEHDNENWDYSKLSRNTNITLQNVLDHWYLPWNLGDIIMYKY